MNFNLPQCQTLLWDQINEKAALLQEIKESQIVVGEAKEDAHNATVLADTLSNQLITSKNEIYSKLQAAEKQRVHDIWTLMKAQQPQQQEGNTVEVDYSSATKVAIQRAQDLEFELEGYISNDERMAQVNTRYICFVFCLCFI